MIAEHLHEALADEPVAPRTPAFHFFSGRFACIV